MKNQKTPHPVASYAHKNNTLLLAVACAVAASVNAWSHPDVSQVYLIKEHDLFQDSTSDPAGYQYELRTGVQAKISGSITAASFTPPGGSSQSIADLGGGTFQFSAGGYGSLGALNANWPDGNYSFTIATTNAPNPYLPTLNLSGSYPSAIPKFSNTDWFGNNLQFDPTQSYTFSWNSSGGAGVALGLGSAGVFFLGTDATSYTLAANTFSPGTDFTANLSFSYGSSSTDNGTFLSAEFTNTTEIDISTVPEPSTSLLLILGGVGSLIALRRRGAGLGSR